MYLDSANLVGWTLELESSRASAISPKANLAANAGIGKRVGRDRTRPSDLVNSRLVQGFGETALMGPDIVLFERQCVMIASKSSSVTQLIN